MIEAGLGFAGGFITAGGARLMFKEYEQGFWTFGLEEIITSIGLLCVVLGVMWEKE